MSVTSRLESKEKASNTKQYSITFHMTSGSKLNLQACFTEKDIERFTSSFSSEEGTTQWMIQVLPQANYVINLANINMVELVEIDKSSKDLENEVQEPKQT